MSLSEQAGNTHWVFGYGSLIWNPGFAFRSCQPALLAGAHRRLAIYSHHYRGTLEHPGLVFGLVRGGSCRGMAFEVEEADWPAAIAYLRERELVTNVYREMMRSIRLGNGMLVEATAYLVDESHEQFAGRLSLEDQLRLVRTGAGVNGSNADYVLNTAQHLLDMGIKDRHLLDLAALLR